MLRISPQEIETHELHQWLLGSIGPRPIAFASTLDENDNPNLAPFSFFNVFSANPPILIFSPARRVRDNTTKHTLENVLRSKEVVINVVNYSMVEQMSLTSTEYPQGVNEFHKSGLTAIKSEQIAPFRVKESPVQLECKVNEVIALGNEGGAGNLVICEVLLMHVNPEILTEEGKIDPFKIDLVSRMGGDWYCRAQGDSLFEVEKPNRKLGIGVDALPKSIRDSYILSGNDLGKLGNTDALPSSDEVEEFLNHHRIQSILSSTSDGMERREKLHEYAKELLNKNKVQKAWKALMCDLINRN
jgi:flavin reductase (DIM6/NTAB) family NADH-FMN oxidoreductase RutF